MTSRFSNGTSSRFDFSDSVYSPNNSNNSYLALNEELNKYDSKHKQIINVANPTTQNSAINKQYLEDYVGNSYTDVVTNIELQAIDSAVQPVQNNISDLETNKINPAYNHSIEEHFNPQLFQDHLTTHSTTTYSGDWNETDTNNPKFIQNKPVMENYVTKTNPTVSNLKVEGDFEATGFKITQSDIVYNNRVWATQYNSNPVNNIIFNMKSPNIFNIRSISLTLEGSKNDNGDRCGADDVTIIFSINDVIQAQLNNYNFNSWGLNTIPLTDVNNPISINVNDIIKIEMINNSIDRKIVTKFQDKIDAEFISLNLDGDMSIEKMIELRLIGIEIDTASILATEWDENEGRHILNVSERLKLGLIDNVETIINENMINITNNSDVITSLETSNGNQDISIANHSTRITNLETNEVTNDGRITVLESAPGTDISGVETRLDTLENNPSWRKEVVDGGRSVYHSETGLSINIPDENSFGALLQPLSFPNKRIENTQIDVHLTSNFTEVSAWTIDIIKDGSLFRTYTADGGLSVGTKLVFIDSENEFNYNFNDVSIEILIRYSLPETNKTISWFSMEGLVTNGEMISFDPINFKLEPIENRITPIETNVSTLQTNRSIDYSNIVQIIPKINKLLGYMQDIGKSAKQYSITTQAIADGTEAVPIPFGSREDLSGWIDATTYLNEGKMLVLKSGVYLTNYNLYFTNPDTSIPHSFTVSLKKNGEVARISQVRTYVNDLNFNVSATAVLQLNVNDDIQILIDHNGRNNLTHGGSDYYQKSSFEVTLLKDDAVVYEDDIQIFTS